MRKVFTETVERGRIIGGEWASRRGDTFGAFHFVRMQKGAPVYLRVIVGDGLGWDHVSVSTPRRCPTWEEMDWIRGLFFEDDETVMQLHVPKADHINVHEFCLHMWRPHSAAIPLPPKEMVA